MSTDAELGLDMAQLDDAERLARAVLLFHKAPPWTDQDSEVWLALTGQVDATSKVLCDLAREIRAKHETPA